MTRIGVFGGSFNPVHKGHIKLAEAGLDELNLDKVVFVPSYLTPLKKESELLPAPLRFLMVKQAIKKYPNFSVSDYEMRKKRISYTVDTLKYFKKKFGRKAQLYFLSGADTPESLSRWKSPDKILKLCRFAIFSRPGHRLNQGGGTPPLRITMDALPISSTEIRRRLKKGQSVRALVPVETLKPLEKYYQ